MTEFSVHTPHTHTVMLRNIIWAPACALVESLEILYNEKPPTAPKL